MQYQNTGNYFKHGTLSYQIFIWEEELMEDLSPRPGELEPIEVASRDEISALQLQQLKWSLNHAYQNVPHYRTAFDKVGIHPDDLKSLSDLSKFPFTVKSDLRNNYPF